MRKELCSFSVPPQLRDGDPRRQRRGEDVWSAQVSREVLSAQVIREAPPTQVSREGWSAQVSREGWSAQVSMEGWSAQVRRKRWSAQVSQCSVLPKGSMEEWIRPHKNMHALPVVAQTGHRFI